MHLTPEGENDWTYVHHADSFAAQVNLGGFMDVYSTAVPGQFQVPMIEYILILARRGSSRLTFSENGLEERLFINNDTITDWIRDWKRTAAGHCYLSERPWASEIVYREMDTDGNLLREYIHTKPEFQNISKGDIHALPDDGYLYTYRYFENFSTQETVFGRRAGNGDILWERDDNEPNNYESTGGIERIVMTTDGTVVLSEYIDDYSTPNPTTDFGGDFVLRGFAAATGEELWYHVFQTPAHSVISQLIPAANGDVIGTGWRFVQELEEVGDFGYFVAWIFRASSSGEILWERNFTTASAAIYEPRLQDLVELPDGRIAAVGYSQNGFFPNGFPNLDVWLVVVDENGCLEPGCGGDVVVNAREAAKPLAPTWTIQPNPARDVLHFTLPIDDLTKIMIYNSQGL